MNIWILTNTALLNKFKKNKISPNFNTQRQSASNALTLKEVYVLKMKITISKGKLCNVKLRMPTSQKCRHSFMKTFKETSIFPNL